MIFVRLFRNKQNVFPVSLFRNKLSKSVFHCFETKKKLVLVSPFRNKLSKSVFCFTVSKREISFLTFCFETVKPERRFSISCFETVKQEPSSFLFRNSFFANLALEICFLKFFENGTKIPVCGFYLSECIIVTSNNPLVIGLFATTSE